MGVGGTAHPPVGWGGGSHPPTHIRKYAYTHIYANTHIRVWVGWVAVVRPPPVGVVVRPTRYGVAVCAPTLRVGCLCAHCVWGGCCAKYTHPTPLHRVRGWGVGSLWWYGPPAHPLWGGVGWGGWWGGCYGSGGNCSCTAYLVVGRVVCCCSTYTACNSCCCTCVCCCGVKPLCATNGYSCNTRVAAKFALTAFCCACVTPCFCLVMFALLGFTKT